MLFHVLPVELFIKVCNVVASDASKPFRTTTRSSFHALYRMMILDRFAYDNVMNHPSARKMWLKFALDATGFQPSEVENMVCVSSPEFHRQIRLLVCPWISIPQELHLKIPEQMYIVNGRSLSLLGHGQLGFNTASELYMTIRDEPFVVSLPSRPCSEADFDAQLRTLDALSTREERWPFPSATRIVHGNVIPKLVEANLTVRPIHASAFAVMEYFEEESCYTEAHCNGIYFFFEGRYGSPRMQLHLRGQDFDGMVGLVDLCAGPMELWLATERRLLYFGPYSHPSCRVCSPSASVDDKLFWDVYFNRMQPEDQHLYPMARSAIGNRTAVHYAVQSEEIEALRTVIASGADPNVCDAFGESPMQMAIKLNWVEAIELLADARHIRPMLLHVTAKDQDAFNSVYETVQALLKLGADPNHPMRDAGRTVVSSSVFLDNPELLELMHANRADLTHRDMEGFTPIHYAVISKRMTTSRVLIGKYGCDVNAQSVQGVTPLMLAVQGGWFFGVRMLVEQFGADLYIENAEGFTASDMAARGFGQRNEAIFRFLYRQAEREKGAMSDDDL